MTLDEHQIERYSRHIILPNFGGQGQERLLAATVLLVGVGRSALTAALHVAAAGVGRLVLIDNNRYAQIALAAAITARNPDVIVDVAHEWHQDVELVLCFQSAAMVLADWGDFSLRTATPFIITRVGDEWGEVVVLGGESRGPCYKCWQATPLGGPANQVAEGLLGAVAAGEALRSLLGIGKSSMVVRHDFMQADVSNLPLLPNTQCPRCRQGEGE